MFDQIMINYFLRQGGTSSMGKSEYIYYTVLPYIVWVRWSPSPNIVTCLQYMCVRDVYTLSSERFITYTIMLYCTGVSWRSNMK